MATGGDVFSSALLNLLFDDDTVGRCLVAPDGTILRTNAEWRRSTGYSAAEVLGADLIGLFPTTRDMALAMHARARAGHRVEMPRHMQRIRGIETWWEGRIEPVAMERGTGLLITTREVDAPAAQARRPHSATELADYLRDVGPAGIVLFEPAPPFRVLSTNEAYLQLWPEPLRSRGLVGLALTDFIRDAEEAGVAEVFRDVARTRVTRHLEEFPYPLADGEHWFNWTLVPVVRGGELVALANMAVDITREVRARKEAERARDESRRGAELLELGDALCELDRDYRVVRVNARQEKLTGVPRAASLGKTHWELWPETGKPDSPWWIEYHRCMEERVPVQFENYYAPSSSGATSPCTRRAPAGSRSSSGTSRPGGERRRRCGTATPSSAACSSRPRSGWVGSTSRTHAGWTSTTPSAGCSGARATSCSGPRGRRSPTPRTSSSISCRSGGWRRGSSTPTPSRSASSTATVTTSGPA